MMLKFHLHNAVPNYFYHTCPTKHELVHYFHIVMTSDAPWESDTVSLGEVTTTPTQYCHICQIDTTPNFLADTPHCHAHNDIHTCSDPSCNDAQIQSIDPCLFDLPSRLIQSASIDISHDLPEKIPA